MSAFDVAAFENQIVEGANETKTTPVPEGDYNATIDTARVKSIAITRGERAGQEVPVLEVNYHLHDDTGELNKLLNRDKVTVRQDIWLDVNEHGSLAFGPNLNVQLGRLREAVGLNQPGRPFTFKMLEGQGPLVISVSHDTRENGDVYNRVQNVRRG